MASRRVVQFWAIQMNQTGMSCCCTKWIPNKRPRRNHAARIESVRRDPCARSPDKMIRGYHSEAGRAGLFCPGTLIATPAVSRLGRGAAHRSDRSARRPGAQPLRWIGVQRLRFDRARRLRTCRSECQGGALGPDLPQREPLLSPPASDPDRGRPDEVLAPAQGVQGSGRGPEASRLPAGGISLPAA